MRSPVTSTMEAPVRATFGTKLSFVCVRYTGAFREAGTGTRSPGCRPAPRRLVVLAIAVVNRVSSDKMFSPVTLLWNAIEGDRRECVEACDKGRVRFSWLTRQTGRRSSRA